MLLHLVDILPVGYRPNNAYQYHNYDGGLCCSLIVFPHCLRCVRPRGLGISNVVFASAYRESHQAKKNKRNMCRIIIIMCQHTASRYYSVRVDISETQAARFVDSHMS